MDFFHLIKNEVSFFYLVTGQLDFLSFEGFFSLLWQTRIIYLNVVFVLTNLFWKLGKGMVRKGRTEHNMQIC